MAIVAAAAEGGLELLHDQEDLAVISAGIVPGLDVDRPCLAGVHAAVEVGAGHHVRVIEAEAGWARNEHDALHPMRGNERRALFRGAIDIARDHLSMPMHKLGDIGVIMDIDDHSLPLLEAQQWARELAVVGRGGDNAVGSQLHQAGADAQRVVGLDLFRFRTRLGGLPGAQGQARCSGADQEIPPAVKP
jgi:hypothetical protein